MAAQIKPSKTKALLLHTKTTWSFPQTPISTLSNRIPNVSKTFRIILLAMISPGQDRLIA